MTIEDGNEEKALFAIQIALYEKVLIKYKGTRCDVISHYFTYLIHTYSTIRPSN